MASRFRWLRIVLGCIALAGFAACPRSTLASEPTLLSLVSWKSTLQSIEVYHIDDAATYRTHVYWYQLIASPERADDYLRIGSSWALGRELKDALAGTTVESNETCRRMDIDVRWGFVLHFEDGTRAVITFNRKFPCVEMESQHASVGVRGEFFRFVERRFGYLITSF